jgi:type I restriction enzyme S subunit
MSLWAETTLKKVAEKISYGYTTSAIEQNTGIKFLRITDIASGAIDWDTVPYCEISEIDLEKCLLTQGDIVIARTGATVGYAKQIRPNSPKSVFASYLVRVKLKNNVCKRFIGILTESDNYKYYINTIAGGSAQPNANAQDLCSYPFYLPQIHVQKKIAAILSAYDELIVNNQRRIELLEKMAEEIYREWFVRLRFPGHEKVKKVKGVSEGWEVKKLGSVLEFCYGKALKDDDRVSGEFHVYGSSGVVGTHNEALVKTPGLIVGRKGNVGSVYWSDRGFFPIDTVYYVKSELPNSFLYFLLRSMNFINNDAAVPGLNRNQAYSNLFFLPPAQLIKRYVEIADSLFKMKRVLTRKNEYLTSMRDKLLPRLISGKLSVEHLDIQFPPGMEESAHAD